MEDGRRTDVLVEDSCYTDPRTGLLVRSRIFIVWADPGLEEVIKSVPGITNVYNNCSPTEYTVFYDPRYDHEWLRAEIEAVIKIGVEND